jgi:hypothetical protein
MAEHASSRYEYPFQAVDAYSQNFERDEALWFDNAYSDVVPRELYYKDCTEPRPACCSFNHAYEGGPNA